MFRLLHSSHRVNPIDLDFDSGVRLVKLHLPAAGGESSGCSPECLRRASSDVASFCEPRDAEMIDIQQASFGGVNDDEVDSDYPYSSPAASQCDVTAAVEEEPLVSTPVQTRASCRLHAASSTPATAAVPAAAVPQSCLEQLRLRRPRRFYEICRVHLAFVTEVPPDFLQDLIDGAASAAPSVAAAGSTARTPSARMLVERVCRSMRQHHHQYNPSDQACFATSAPTVGAGAPPAHTSASADDAESPNAEILSGIRRLIRLLAGRLDAEGIFRKSGQVGRQRQLRQLLEAEPAGAAATRCGGLGLEAAVAELRCCVHDIAGVLKASLGDLRQPLLTDRLRPYFLQVAGLHPHRPDLNGNPTGPDTSLAAARQLRGYRILLQLLPRENCRLLRCLLRMLRRVADLSSRTLMTPENLGTVFGPLLLCPREMQSTDDYTRVIALSNEAVAYMIRYVGEIFKVPEHLAIDAMRSLDRSRCRSRSCVEDAAAAATAAAAAASSASSADLAENAVDANEADDDEEAVDVCVAFVDRAAASRVDGREYTQLQVAELYAAVQAMPESARKAALVRKFNAAANGGLQGAACRSPFKQRRTGAASAK